MVQSWLVGLVMRWVLARLRAGDIRPTLWLDHPDVVMTFPGTSSFSGVIRGREEHAAWLSRLVRIGVETFADEVTAVGPPWRTTACLRGHDLARGPGGEVVYANRFVIWAHLRWGRLVEYEVYEDTEKADAFDAWLARSGSGVA